MFKIKRIQIDDIEKIVFLVKKLFTNTPIDKLRNELIQDLVKKDIAIFVCYLKNGHLKKDVLNLQVIVS